MRPCPRAQGGIELVRDFLEEKVGKDFGALAEKLGDQAAFQKLALDMLRELDLTRPTDAPDESDSDSPDDEDGPEDDSQGEDDSQSQGDPQAAEMAGEMAEGDGDG